MNNVEFEEEQQESRNIAQNVQMKTEKSWMFRLVEKLSGGKIDDQKGVNAVLVAFIVVIVVLSIMIYSVGDGSIQRSQPEQPMYKMDIPAEYLQKYSVEINELPDPFYISDIPEDIRNELAP